MRTSRTYDNEYKIQAVKLAEEIGAVKAIKELGIPDGTLYTWLRQAANGSLDTGKPLPPSTSRRLACELKDYQKKVKQLEIEIREKDRVIACLKEATAFFAASQKR
jgi:transposase